MTPRQRLVVRAWPWVLALLVLLPVLGPGYVLSYDMVWVPDLALRPDFLGLGSGLPRAVPSDALVAVLDEVVPGMVLQKVVLVAALLLAGDGARRLVPQDSVVAQLAATSFYVWTPYVAERLVIGHWPLLLAYGALPWVVLTARRAVRDDRVPAGLVLALALGATSASGGLMTAVAALAFGGGGGRPGRSRRRSLVIGLWALAVNAPWLVAGLLHAGDAVTDPAGATAFAAGGEGRLPAVLAVLGLGGIWNVEVVPGSRMTVLPWLALLLGLGVCAAGFRPWRGWAGPSTVVRAAVCAGVGMFLALAGVVAPSAVAWTVANVPGVGLVRDGSRYIGLLAVVLAPLFGCGAARLVRLVRDDTARVAVAVGLVAAPLALLPDLAWGVAGRLTPVGYPPDYAEARAAVTGWKQHGGGDLLVLPFTTYRAPEWNHRRKVLDPLGRYLPLDYLASDGLSVSGRMIAGEDPRGPVVLRLLRRGTPESRAAGLARLGVGIVVTDRSAPGGTDGPFVADVAGEPMATVGSLEVVALEAEVVERGPARWEVTALGLAWAAFLAAVAWSVTSVVRERVQRSLSSRTATDRLGRG